MNHYRKIEAVLFDQDGVIIDSEGIRRKTWIEALAIYGVQVTDKEFDEDYKDMMGKPSLKNAEYLVRKYEIKTTPEEFLRKREELLDKYFPTIGLREGVRDLLDYLKERGIEMALVTSAFRRHVEMSLKNNGLEDYFTVIISKEDIRKGKPDPEPYRLACEKLGIKPKNAVVIEDSENGVLSGKRAGCLVIAVRHRWNQHLDFSSTDYVAEDMIEIGEIIKSMIS